MTFQESKPLVIKKKVRKKTTVSEDATVPNIALSPMQCKLMQQARDSKKLSLKELAQRINKHVSVVRDMEKGVEVGRAVVVAVEKELDVRFGK